MPDRTARELNAIFEKLIDFLGYDAFAQEGLTLLYSGPQDEILKELFGRAAKQILSSRKNRSNARRAAVQAKKLSAVRIDDTRLGQSSLALRLYAFFRARYADDPETGRAHADEVMGYLSRKFIRAVSGHVITAVCGAGQDRVFRATELPELVLNPRIQTVNGVAWHSIRNLFFSDPVAGPHKAFRLVCLSELRMSLRRARIEKTKEASEDYYYRKAFYQIERRLTRGNPNNDTTRDHL
ncbi:MAG: hypothetical protein FJ006_11070 [Chloroflexi bacterium]|nr:hypothetical protein [Chloroflexota bacterium]